MTKIKDFNDLKAWQKGHELTLLIYRLSKTFPKEEKYGLTNQLRRASSSITANIAEGFGRYHFADKIRFYYQARGSLKETQNFLLLAEDLHYIKQRVVDNLWNQTKDIEKLISGLIRSTEKQKK